MNRADIETVLRAHAIECTGPGEVTCQGCREDGWMSWFAYHAHVADQLLPLFADVWDEGYGNGCCEHGNECDWGNPHKNPYLKEATDD